MAAPAATSGSDVALLHATGTPASMASSTGRPNPSYSEGKTIPRLPRINAAFGLAPEQIERLAPDRRIVVFKAISSGGGVLIGKVVTRDLVLWMLKLVGVRLSTQQAAKFVPIAGQAVSAALTYSALRYVCEQHIQQCIAITRLLALPAPAAA